VDGYKRFVKVR
jgi:hypothetical protein